MSTVHRVLSFAAATLLATSACLVGGYDNLTDCCSSSGATASGTTQAGDGASNTSAPSSTAGGPTTGSDDGTTASATSPTEALTSGACTGSCGTTTGTTGVGGSTCGAGECGGGTSSGETGDTAANTTTGDTTTGCMGDCTPRRVFVTFNGYAGNFAAGTDAFTAADKKCQDDADMKGLVGEFKAWISVGPVSPSMRLDTSFEGDYVLPLPMMDPGPPVVVAHGWANLVGGTLEHPIDADAAGTSVAVAPTVWTGTTADGTAATTCGNWDTTNGMAMSGSIMEMSAAWTEAAESSCAGMRRLYCFEDPT